MTAIGQLVSINLRGDKKLFIHKPNIIARDLAGKNRIFIMKGGSGKELSEPNLITLKKFLVTFHYLELDHAAQT